MGFFRYGQTSKEIVIRDENLTSQDVVSIIEAIQRRCDVSHNIAIANSNAAVFMKHFLSEPLSATDIEDIITCPQYFLDKKLFVGKELEKDEIGIQPFDIGIIYHDVFAKFYRGVFSNGVSFDRKNIEKCYAILDDVVKKVFLNSTMLIEESKIDKEFLQANVLKTCRAFIEKEIERAENDEMLYAPIHMEYDFSDYGIYQNNGTDVRINGRVDRIDLCYQDNDASKEIIGVRIIDYKSKTKTIRDTIDKDNIQLMLYLKYITESNKFNLAKTDLKQSIAYIGYNQLTSKTEKYFNEYRDEDKKPNKIKSLMDSLNDSLIYNFDNISKGKIEYNSENGGCEKCRKKDICLSSHYLSGVDD